MDDALPLKRSKCGDVEPEAAVLDGAEPPSKQHRVAVVLAMGSKRGGDAGDEAGAAADTKRWKMAGDEAARPPPEADSARDEGDPAYNDFLFWRLQ